MHLALSSSAGHTPIRPPFAQARDAGLGIEALGERIRARKEQLKQQFAGGKLPPSHTRSFSGHKAGGGQSGRGGWRRLTTVAAVVASALAAGNYPEPSALLAHNGHKESAPAPSHAQGRGAKGEWTSG
jgi:hypothetical protein